MSKATVVEAPAKRGRPVGVTNNSVRNAVLKAFKELGGSATAKEAGTTSAQVAAMVKTGYLKATKSRVPTGGRGRPAIKYTLAIKSHSILRKLEA